MMGYGKKKESSLPFMSLHFILSSRGRTKYRIENRQGTVVADVNRHKQLFS